MKLNLLSILLLFQLFIIAQPTFITVKTNSEEYTIAEKIIMLQEFLNYRSNIGVNNYLENFFTKDLIERNKSNDFKNHDYLNDVKITIQSLDLEDTFAKVTILCSYTNEVGNRITNTENISFLKEESWKFSNIGSIESVVFKLINEGSNEIDGYSIIQPIINDYTFHQIPVFIAGGQPVYEFNYQKTEQYFNKQLFAANQGLNWAGWYWGPNSNGGYLKIALILDQGWRRIVFSKDALDGVIRLYDYGRWQGNQEFKSPRSIDINEYGEVFVADDISKCIYKFNYHLSTNTITAPPQPIYISNPSHISKPVDIDYYSGRSYGNRNDDRIVIADQGLNCITIFDGVGNYLNKITHFYVNGIGYVPITEPRSVVLYGFDNPPYKIAFIDGGSNSLVCGFLNESTTYLSPFNTPTKFIEPSKLYDIGVDGCYNLLVTDLYGQLIHKFNKLGKYSCSYNKNQQILNPFFASNVVDNCDYYSHAMHFYIGGAWGRDNGITEYVPGADVLNLNHANFNTYYRFNFFPTDEIEYQVRLLKASNNQIVRIWSGTALTASTDAVFQDKNSSLVNGEQYKWVIFYRPLYDDDYGQYAVGWKVKTGPTFTHSIVAPMISNFSQYPNPLYKGQNGWITCNLSQGISNLNYQWTIEYGQNGFSISDETSSNVKIHYSNSEATSKPNTKLPYNNGFETDDYDDTILKCKVWNELGKDSEYVAVRLANNSHIGCPFVYTWNGEEWIEDNNILPQSQDPNLVGQDVTDHYPLFTEPILEDEKYYLAVGEFENERSYLDQLKLLVIDHPHETFITVNDDGEIIQIAKPAYFADAQLDSIQVLEYLNSLDDVKVEVAAEDTLTLWFDDTEGEPYLLVIGQSNATAKDKITGRIKGNNSESFSSFRLRRNPTYQWIMVPVSNTSSLRIEMDFEEEAAIDYAELSREQEMPFTVYTPELLYAEHTFTGDVTSQINATDQTYVELIKDEMITLEFAAPPLDESSERTFIFISRGRYEIDERLSKQGNLTEAGEEPVIPKETKLYENYPNPFNPITNIKYSLKNDGRVTIKVYNALGQEVKILADEIKHAGYYEVQFDASELASGMYIFKMQTSDYSLSRKMMLLK